MPGAAAKKSPLKLVSVSAIAGSPGQQAATRAPPARQSDAEMLAAEFPEYDASLIACMLQDQGGDVKDVRYALQVSCRLSPPPLTCTRLCTRRPVHLQFGNSCRRSFGQTLLVFLVAPIVSSAEFVFGKKLAVCILGCPRLYSADQG